MTSSELEYCTMRARVEANRALVAKVREAALAHQNLPIRYAARAFSLRSESQQNEGVGEKIAG